MNKKTLEDIELVMKTRIRSVRFRKLPNDRGQYDEDRDEIIIDPTWRGSPIKTFVHEKLHKADPTWGNTPGHSCAREDHIWRNLNTEQKVILGRQLFGRKWTYRNGTCHSVPKKRKKSKNRS